MSIKSRTEIKQHDENSKQFSGVTPTWIVTSVPELWLQFGIYCKIRRMSCLKYWLYLFIDCGGHKFIQQKTTMTALWYSYELQL